MIKLGLDEFLFMAEAEGLTDLVETREAKINALIKYVKAYREPTMPEDVFWAAAESFSIPDLTPREIRRILRSIR